MSAAPEFVPDPEHVADYLDSLTRLQWTEANGETFRVVRGAKADEDAKVTRIVDLLATVGPGYADAMVYLVAKLVMVRLIIEGAPLGEIELSRGLGIPNGLVDPAVRMAKQLMGLKVGDDGRYHLPEWHVSRSKPEPAPGPAPRTSHPYGRAA